jgi:hypothetical protein
MGSRFRLLVAPVVDPEKRGPVYLGEQVVGLLRPGESRWAGLAAQAESQAGVRSFPGRTPALVLPGLLGGHLFRRKSISRISSQAAHSSPASERAVARCASSSYVSPTRFRIACLRSSSSRLVSSCTCGTGRPPFIPAVHTHKPVHRQRPGAGQVRRKRESRLTANRSIPDICAVWKLTDEQQPPW